MAINILCKYMCVQFQKIIGKSKKEMSVKEYVSGLGWDRINMVLKCLVHMSITAELKAYKLLVYK